MKKLIVFALLGLMGCTTIGHREPPKDWPILKITEHYVPEKDMRDRCAKYTGFGMSPQACMEFDFTAKTCNLWFSADFPPTAFMREHELMHCAGHDHIRDATLSDAWRRYKSTVFGQAVGKAASRF